jgi:hypothetical protein
MHGPTNDPSERPDTAPDPDANDPPERVTHRDEQESGLAAGLRRFSRRLATFGLGEAQEPLLTEEIWSHDVKGNPR